MQPIKLLALCTALALLPAAFSNAFAATSGATSAAAQDSVQEKGVYHINDSARARIAMRNAENNLEASPGIKIVFVAHGKGIDFLLNDARDEKGAFETQVAGLKERGVEFRVCRNTLLGRKLKDDAVVMEATVVPSGVAEVVHLQAREGFAYLKP